MLVCCSPCGRGATSTFTEFFLPQLSHLINGPSEKVHTSTFLTFWHVSSTDPTHHLLLKKMICFSAPLCSCSGATNHREGRHFQANKNPECPTAHRERRESEQCVPVRRFAGSSMLPLSRLTTVTVVKRHFRSASPTIRHWLRARKSLRALRYSAGSQPSGVGRLKVSAACVERATTIRTGSSLDMFISTCTTCGGTQTKSPAFAS